MGTEVKPYAKAVTNEGEQAMSPITERLLSKKLLAYVVTVIAGVTLAILHIIDGTKAIDILQTATIAYLAAEGGLDAVRVVKGTER